MQYGKQTVPISSEEENHLKYLPEKDMQAIGFVSLDQIPRHMYMKVLPAFVYQLVCYLFLSVSQFRDCNNRRFIRLVALHIQPRSSLSEYQVWWRPI